MICYYFNSISLNHKKKTWKLLAYLSRGSGKPIVQISSSSTPIIDMEHPNLLSLYYLEIYQISGEG